MPYFVNVGPFQSNENRPGARGYHIRRKGRSVVVTWGAISIRRRRYVEYVPDPSDRAPDLEQACSLALPHRDRAFDGLGRPDRGSVSRPPVPSTVVTPESLVDKEIR